ncbi:hypothetical protein ACFQV4_22105 [Streptomyces thermocarboxydus]
MGAGEIGCELVELVATVAAFGAPGARGGCSPLRSASTRARRSASRRAVPRRRALTRSCTERAARSAATAAMTMPARATAPAPPRTSHSAPVGLIPLERTVNSTAAQALRATATGGSTASRSSCDRRCDSGRPGAGRAGGRPCRPPSRRSGRGRCRCLGVRRAGAGASGRRRSGACGPRPWRRPSPGVGAPRPVGSLVRLVAARTGPRS